MILRQADQVRSGAGVHLPGPTQEPCGFVCGLEWVVEGDRVTRDVDVGQLGVHFECCGDLDGCVTTPDTSDLVDELNALTPSCLDTRDIS